MDIFVLGVGGDFLLPGSQTYEMVGEIGLG